MLASPFPSLPSRFGYDPMLGCPAARDSRCDGTVGTFQSNAKQGVVLEDR